VFTSEFQDGALVARSEEQFSAGKKPERIHEIIARAPQFFRGAIRSDPIDGTRDCRREGSKWGRLTLGEWGGDDCAPAYGNSKSSRRRRICTLQSRLAGWGRRLFPDRRNVQIPSGILGQCGDFLLRRFMDHKGAARIGCSSLRNAQDQAVRLCPGQNISARIEG
jgi:hypothetical protein